jgi:hypothetical protein
LVALLLSCTLGAVAASYLVPVPSFVKYRGTVPARTARIDLQIQDLTCRGRANLFAYFLERDDLLAVPGYLHIAAWPAPGLAEVRVTYDPDQTSDAAIKRALTEPYYDSGADVWRPSPFRIEGYDPLDADLETLDLPESPGDL